MNILNLYSMTPISELGGASMQAGSIGQITIHRQGRMIYSGIIYHMNGGDSLFQGRMIYSGIIYHRRIDYSGVEHPGE